MKITILGAGAFGFALAHILSRNPKPKKIFIFDLIPEYIESIQKDGSHPVFHSGINLPAEKINATLNLEEAVRDTDLIILAVPGNFIRKAVSSTLLHLSIEKEVTFLNLAKALEAGTNLPIHKIVKEVVAKEKPKLKYHFAALSGGMLANEVCQGCLTAADLACENQEVADQIKLVLQTSAFKINTSDDVVGVIFAGIIKNVLAIGAGFFDGLKLPNTSKAAFVSIALEEMKVLGLKEGGKAKTFALGTQAYLGDILTCCFGDSRNRMFGELIAKKGGADAALKELSKEKKIAEGYHTTKALYERMLFHNLEIPTLRMIYQVLYENKDPRKAVEEIFKTD